MAIRILQTDFNSAMKNLGQTGQMFGALNQEKDARQLSYDQIQKYLASLKLLDAKAKPGEPLSPTATQAAPTQANLPGVAPAAAPVNPVLPNPVGQATTSVGGYSYPTPKADDNSEWAQMFRSIHPAEAVANQLPWNILTMK